MAEAALRKTRLTVLAVHPVASSYWTGNPTPYPGDEEKVAEVRKSAESAVAAVAEKRGEKPESITVTAISGLPAHALIEASKDSDLVVVGTRGGGGFGPLTLGSVSSQVANHSSCPVVVVPTGG